MESGKWKNIINESLNIDCFSPRKVRGDEIDFFSSKTEKFYHWNPQKNDIYYDEFQIRELKFLENSWIDYCKRHKRELRGNIIVEERLTIQKYIDIINTDTN